MDEELVAIAKIVRPRGLRGEVVAEILTDFPERFDGLETVVGVLTDGTRTDLRIDASWLQNNRIVLKLAGVDSIESAEAFRNVELCVPESAAVELAEEEFFDWQLEGCSVDTVDNEHVGIVRGLMRTGGTENLVVENEGREFLIPFARAICTEVDVVEKKVVVDLPDGLLDF